MFTSGSSCKWFHKYKKKYLIKKKKAVSECPGSNMNIYNSSLIKITEWMRFLKKCLLNEY